MLRDRKFWPFFYTQFCGAFNDNMFKNALVTLITYQSIRVFGVPSPQMVAFCGGIFILPFFLFSGISGQIADKYEKTFLIRLVKISEIIIMASAVLGFVFKQYEILIFVLFFMGVHSTIFGPIKYSILPQIFSENDLVKANAYVSTGTFIAILVGTILGNILVSIDERGALISIAVMFVAIIGFIFSKFIYEAPAADPQLKIDINPFTPTWKVLKITLEDRQTFLSILGISWFWFYGASLLALFPTYAKDVIFADQYVMNLFFTLFSIGIGVGSFLCEKLSFHKLEIGIVPLGALGLTLFTFDLFLIGPSWASQPDLRSLHEFLQNFIGWRVTFDMALISIFAGFYILPLITFIQEKTMPSIRSRIVASNNILNALFMVVSALLIAKLVSLTSVPNVFACISGLNLIFSLTIFIIEPEFLRRFVAWAEKIKNLPKDK